MSLLKSAALLLFTPQCFDEYFINFNLFDSSCFTSTLSKSLGIVIILGSVLVKLPQILKIIKNKSGEGISLISVSLDLTAITIYASYCAVNAFPFSAWGDAAFMAAQTVAIAVLILYYNGLFMQALGYSLLYIGVCVILIGLTPVGVLWFMQGVNIPILLAGKLAQAYTNYNNGHTGQLSAATLFMMFFGALVRIFTSVTETGDVMTIITFIASSFANGVLVAQLLYYWNVDISKKTN